MNDSMPIPRISIVIPLKDEAASIGPLVDETRAVMQSVGEPYEIVLVDDGSEDETWMAVERLAASDARIVGLRFRHNRGQTAALTAGFDYSRGDIVIPMDGDGQNDPADIPRLLAKLEEGYDVVSGWRKCRHDKAISRVLPSRIANRLISWVGGVRLHDYGCTLKAYRRPIVRGIRLYGEMHRFIPIYASWQGAQVAEIEVNHRPRRQGASKYGLSRTIKVALDLLVVKFFADFLQKPIYVFGAFGLFCAAGGFLSGLLAVYFKYWGGKSFIQTPLPLLTALLFLMGANALFIGLLAELLMRTYYESQRLRTYAIRETLNAPPDVSAGQ